MDIRKMSVGELSHAWRVGTIGTDEYQNELVRRLEAAEKLNAILIAEADALREHESASKNETEVYRNSIRWPEINAADDRLKAACKALRAAMAATDAIDPCDGDQEGAT